MNDEPDELIETDKPQLDIAKAVKAIRLAEEQLKKAELLLGQSSEEVGIYGEFDGEFMTRDDGKKKYRVPPNYASKTMLVAGDKLRMYTAEDGELRYKQVEKIDRVIIEGTAKKDSEGMWYAVTERGNFQIMKASVIYFEVKENDRIRVHIPASKETKWAALESVIRPESETLPDNAVQNLTKTPVVIDSSFDTDSDEPPLGSSKGDKTSPDDIMPDGDELR